MAEIELVGLTAQEINEFAGTALASINAELQRQYWDSPPVPNVSEEANKILKTTVVFNTSVVNLMTALLEANNRKIMQDLQRLGVLKRSR